MDRDPDGSASPRDILRAPADGRPDAEATSRVKQAFLHAGQTAASRDPLILNMIVGSCVAVCVFDQRLSIGGATHFLLPAWQPGDGQPTSRYGDIAVQDLVKRLQNLGCRPANLTAKIFGGACMFQSFRDSNSPHIGDRNAAMALEVLLWFSIPVTARDIGGECGRKVRMWTNTGEVSVERVGAEKWKSGAISY